MHAPTICTIIAKNYLAHARCLTESFLDQHPDGQVFVLLADMIDGAFNPAEERFVTVEARDLAISNFDQMAFRYTVVEFNTAVKPFFLEYLFEHYQLQKLCYFDPDIYFYQPIQRIDDLLTTNSVVLTPHLLESLDDQYMPDEPYILRAGIYNLGFIGLAQGPDLLKLLRWWQQKLLKDCVVDISRGLFVDQRWIDLVPGFFDKVAILRDPGHNAAYWNLKHRDIRFEQGQWRVNDVPLTFYHFSGLPMQDIQAISKHQDRYTLADRPTLEPLFVHYHDRLLANGYTTVRSWPYAYGHFSNSVQIPDSARQLWRNIDGGVRWPHPFDTEGTHGFFHWLNQEVQKDSRLHPLISNLAMELYRQRWDLQQAFPDVLGTHREGYANWFAQSAEEQYLLDRLFVQPIRASLDRPATALPHLPAPPSIGQIVTQANESRRSARQQLYYLVRNPLRRSGLHEPIKRLLGPRMVETIYATLVQSRSLQALPMAPLVGTPTLRRRLYYAVRNPLRRLGLHSAAKRLVGKERAWRIYTRMVQQHQMPPEALTRSAVGQPSQSFFSLPALAGEPIRTEELTAGVNIIGYLRAETGMGEVPRALMRALSTVNYPVAYTDLSNADWARAEDTSVLHLPQGNPYTCNVLCANADMLPQIVQQLGIDFFKGKYNIGFWHWETANFPAQWHDRFDYLNEIWVDSNFVQKTLAAVSPIPVVNVQLPINALLPSDITRSDLGLPEDRFIFLFSFDMRSFVQRKNPRGLVNAYRQAFASKFDKTTLVIKVTNLDAFPREAAELRADLASVNGVLIDRYFDRAQLSGLFATCDAYVSLHRSEGFGLTLAEAMALGKPVIATAYSGNMDFMTPSNSYLVGFHITEVDGDYGPYQRGDEWADPDIEHAAALMRQVVEDPADAARKGARAAEDMRHFYSSAMVARRIIARLDRIISHEHCAK
jgi:glycosyltransferase involved in cell wall biosynthesis